MTDFEGQIWAAQENDEIILVCITKRVKNKIQALNEKGRELRVAEDKLLWQAATHAHSQNDWQDKVQHLQHSIEQLRQEIDVTLLWENALELEISALEELADLYFGGKLGMEHFVAMWRNIADDHLYFKRRGKIWEARSAEQIQELRLQREREQSRAKAQSLATEWLNHAARNLETCTASEEIQPFVDRLECWLRGDNDKFVEELATQIAEQIRISPRELAFDVLQKLGRLPEDADRDVIVAGLKPEFSTAVTEAAQAIVHWIADPSQEITPLAFSIDDEETREVDDALAIEQEGELWKLTIAISDPASVVLSGEVLDREAMRRGTTVYLPTQTVLMLPERVSCDIASLSVDKIRSAVVLRAWVDATGQLIRSAISREAVQVQHRLSYVEADHLLAQGTDTMSEQLRAFANLAQQLNERRIAEGAFTLQRPEYKVKVTQGEIEVSLLDMQSPSRMLVAEMMILGNHIAAKYAQRHQVPIIYRTQDPPAEPITPAMSCDALAFHKVRKLLKASSLSLHPGGHSGLGLSAYTQLTSPLRRFADLVMQRQLVAHLVGDELPYDQDELFKVLATAERTAKEARKVEGDAKRRWFMQYLQQQWGEQPIQVLVIEALQNGYKVEMQPWGVDAFLGTAKHLNAGQVLTAVIDKIRVKAGYARLKLAPPVIATT